MADPLQANDLAGDPAHAATLRRCRAALREGLAAFGDTCEACTWYRDHWTRDREIVRTATLNVGG